jgi:hypothetical protein
VADISKATSKVIWTDISVPVLVGRRGMARGPASSVDLVHRRAQGRAVMALPGSAAAVATGVLAELVTTTKIVPVIRPMATSRTIKKARKTRPTRAKRLSKLFVSARPRVFLPSQTRGRVCFQAAIHAGFCRSFRPRRLCGHEHSSAMIVSFVAAAFRRIYTEILGTVASGPFLDFVPVGSPCIELRPIL